MEFQDLITENVLFYIFINLLLRPMDVDSESPTSIAGKCLQDYSLISQFVQVHKLFNSFEVTCTGAEIFFQVVIGWQTDPFSLFELQK